MRPWLLLLAVDLLASEGADPSVSVSQSERGGNPSQRRPSTVGDDESKSAFHELSTYGEDDIPFFKEANSPVAPDEDSAASAAALLRLVDRMQQLKPLRPVPSQALQLTGKGESLDEKALKKRAKERRGALLRREDTALEEKQQQLKGKYVEGTDVAELHAEVYRVPWWRKALYVLTHFLSTGGQLPEDDLE